MSTPAPQHSLASQNVATAWGPARRAPILAPALSRRSLLDPWVVVAVAMIAAAALRFATLGVQSLDQDETVTVWLLHLPFGRMLATIPHTESTPPLYYVLAWLWTRAFGTGAVGVRSLSGLIGVAIVPVAYGAARTLAGARAGRIAAILAALSPGLIWYSQEARAYALLALLSTASLLCLGRALDALHTDEGTRADRTTIRRRLGAWGVVAALALTAHYFAAFLIVPEGVWLLIAAGRPRAREAVASIAVVAAVGLALVPLALRQQASGGTSWIAQLPLGGRLADIPPQMLLGDGRPFYRYFTLVLGTAAIAPLLIVLIRGRGRARRAAVLTSIVVLCGVALPTIIDVAGTHIVADRNMMGVAAVLLIASAIGMAATPRAIGFAALLVVGAMFAWDTQMVLTNPLLQREDWRDAAKALGPATEPRAILYAPLTDNPAPTPPLVPFQAAYLPSVVTIPRAGATVRELDVLNVRDDLSDRTPPPKPVPPGHGFKLISRAGGATFTLFRFRSAKPVHVVAGELKNAGLIETRDDSEELVGLQRP